VRYIELSPTRFKDFWRNKTWSPEPFVPLGSCGPGRHGKKGATERLTAN